MSSRPAETESSLRCITHGGIVVLAHLDRTDAACHEGARDTELAESTVWQWLTDLDDAGIIDSTATRPDHGRPVVEYHLEDDTLGMAASYLLDRVIAPASHTELDEQPAPMPDADDRHTTSTDGQHGPSVA